MKLPILFLSFVTVAQLSMAQQYTRALTCLTDTTFVPEFTRHYMERPSQNIPAHKEITCLRMAHMGAKGYGGLSSFYYNKATRNWLGNHLGGYLGLGLAYHQFNIALKTTVSSVTPNKTIAFGQDTLTTQDNLGVKRLEFITSYSIDLKHYISIEPYSGYSNTVFRGYNKTDTNKTYHISHAGGITFGVTVTKYFKGKNYQYLGLYASGGYTTTNYKKTAPQLGRGYAEWTAGIVFKMFAGSFVKETVQ